MTPSVSLTQGKHPFGCAYRGGVSPKDLLAATSSENPVEALSAIRLLREHLLIEERRAVAEAREQEFSWQQIATFLGQTRQSVWARYR